MSFLVQFYAFSKQEQNIDVLGNAQNLKFHFPLQSY